MGTDRRRGVRSRSIGTFRPDTAVVWGDRWPALSSAGKNFSREAVLLDGRSHGDRSAWLISDTPRPNPGYRRMRGGRINALGQLLCHPLLDRSGSSRPNPIEPVMQR